LRTGQELRKGAGDACVEAMAAAFSIDLRSRLGNAILKNQAEPPLNFQHNWGHPGENANCGSREGSHESAI
jgi:hypothetical protein